MCMEKNWRDESGKNMKEVIIATGTLGGGGAERVF